MVRTRQRRLDPTAAFREPRASTPAASLTTVWGASIELDPLAILRRAAATRSITTDHLVFLLPSVAAGTATDKTSNARRARTAIEDALVARVALIARLLMKASVAANSGSASPAADIIQALVSANIIDCRSASEARTLLNHDGTDRHSSRPLWPVDEAPTEALIVEELAVLTCLVSAAGRNPAEAVLIETTLSDAIVTSIHARVNASYVIQVFDFAHELLTTASWLGQLFAGRPAMMPCMVAECIVDVLPEPHLADSICVSRPVTPESVLVWYASACCELDVLFKTAQKVAEARVAEIVYPRSVADQSLPVPPVFNRQRTELAGGILDQVLRAINCVR